MKQYYILCILPIDINVRLCYTISTLQTRVLMILEEEKLQQMKLRALSHYGNDVNTRYGDCILLYDTFTLVVYDCGHTRHTQEIESFLEARAAISQVHIVVSHNDSDHTNGVVDLLDYLYRKRSTRNYQVTVYSSLYLKHADKVLALLDDDRRTSEATKQRILETFDKIAEIVETAQDYSFSIVDATTNTSVASCWIVGPTENEFVEVVAQAIEDDSVTDIEGETVMNAASVQLKCKLDSADMVLLCGDATPAYLHRLNSYQIIQLPHHGKLDSAKEIFEKILDPRAKAYLVSDNTGSGANSGGSDDLIRYMREEKFKPALNTKNGEVNLPQGGTQGGGGSTTYSRPQGVKLGGMDSRRWF